jgi:DNA-directed RNA polymerase subunit RPC12/RpoP
MKCLKCGGDIGRSKSPYMCTTCDAETMLLGSARKTVALTCDHCGSLEIPKKGGVLCDACGGVFCIGCLELDVRSNWCVYICKPCKASRVLAE